MRDQLGDPGAEIAQRAQRNADAAALRIARQRHRIGRARDADVDRELRPGARETGAIVHHPLRRKAELRHHVDAEALLSSELDLALQRLVERVERNARMAFGIAGDADFADAALLE